MKKYLIYTLYIVINIIMGCDRKNEGYKKIEESIPKVKDDYSDYKINDMRSYLLKNRKTSTLKIIWYALHEIKKKDLILSDALYMAEFENNPFACHLVFEGFCYVYFPEIEYFDSCNNKGEYFFKLPKKEREVIIKYLEIGAEQKFFKCVDDLIQIYEFEKNPKAEYYKSIKDLKYIEDFY